MEVQVSHTNVKFYNNTNETLLMPPTTLSMEWSWSIEEITNHNHKSIDRDPPYLFFTNTRLVYPDISILEEHGASQSSATLGRRIDCLMRLGPSDLAPGRYQPLDQKSYCYNE